MHANKREEIDIVYAGDIAAAVSLKSATTGDTLADEKQPLLLEVAKFPEPVIAMAIEQRPSRTRRRWVLLAEARAGGSFVQVRTDEETAQTIIAGMGELHLKLLSTVCCVNLRLRLMSESLKLRSVRPFRRKAEAGIEIHQADRRSGSIWPRRVDC